MRRLLFVWLGMAAALLVQAALPNLPELGNARIVVLANNLQNYYYHPNSGRGDYTPEQIAAKTQKIAEMMLESEADIFAFCEVEAQPDVLEYLVSELNTAAGGIYYAAVADGINETWDPQFDNNIKSGFVYRVATVEPYGSNYATTNTTYYRNTMRIQAWTELATGEHFTLSMNHFKAKSDEASQAKRVDNATWLINGLSSSYKVQDPDILIMGDLNAQMDEECMTVLLENNYTEQLLYYDENAYSYIYSRTHELIDHAFANSTMATQITGAAVWHTNTSASYGNRYSDHDAVMVGLRLGNEQGCEEVNADGKTKKILRDGQLIIIRGGVEYTVTGLPVR